MPLVHFAFTYIVSVVVMFLFSVFFMSGSFVGLVPFVAIVPAVILKKALFTPNYEEEPERVF